MPELKKKTFDTILRVKPNRLIRKPGLKERLTLKIDSVISSLSKHPEDFGRNQDIIRKLQFLKEEGLDTPQKQRWAISLLKYLEARQAGKLSLGYKGKDATRVKNLEINKLHLKIMFLRKQLESAKLADQTLEIGRLERQLESAEHNFDNLVEPMRVERQRENEFSKLGKSLVSKDRVIRSDGERHRTEYESAISFFDKRFMPYLEELVEETEKYFGYQNANSLVTLNNLPYLKKYVDLQIALDKELTLEAKMNYLENELPKFKDSPFLHRVLNKLFFRFSQELKRLKSERGKHIITEKLGIDECLFEFDRLKRIALSGEDVFLEEIIAIYGKKKNNLYFNHALRRTINSLPDPSKLSLKVCRKVMGFLSFCHSFEDVKVELYSTEEAYKKRISKLEREQPKITKVLSPEKTIGEFLFGVNSNKFRESEFVSSFLEELEPLFKDISIDDVIDTMIYLVKGACLFSSRKAIGGSYFPSEYFRGNVENALRSYHGDENPAWARERIARISEILKKVNVLNTDRKLMSLNNPREYKSESIREFVEFVLSIQNK